MPNRPINTTRAASLLGEGLSSAEIGKRLAQEEGRLIAYRPCSVQHALWRTKADAASSEPPAVLTFYRDPLLDAIKRVHGHEEAA